MSGTDEEKAARAKAHKLLGRGDYSSCVDAGCWPTDQGGGECDRLTTYILETTAALGVAKGERDEALRDVARCRQDIEGRMRTEAAQTARAEKAERERDEARGKLEESRRLFEAMSGLRVEGLAEVERLREQVQEQPAQWFDAGMSWAENAAMQVLTEMSSFNNLPSDAAATGAGKVHDLIFKERKRRRGPREAGE